MSDIADELRERTFRYMLRILAFCRRLPDTWETREVGRQLLRAGMGTAGNYWSACRGRSRDEFVAKLGVATDEADESVLWLMLMVQSNMAKGTEAGELMAEGREIRAILSKSHRTARQNLLRAKGQSKRIIANAPIRQFTKSI